MTNFGSSKLTDTDKNVYPTTIDTAIIVNHNTHLYENITSTDPDYYIFKLNTSQLVEFYITSGNIQLLSMKLMDNLSVLYYQVESYPIHNSIGFKLNFPLGEYIVKINAEAISPVQYQLWVKYYNPLAEDEYEPDSTPEYATLLEVDSLQYHTLSDADYFRINVQTTSIISFTIESNLYPVSFQLFSSTSQQIPFPQLQNTFALDSGNYSISMRSGLISSFGSIMFNYSIRYNYIDFPVQLVTNSVTTENTNSTKVLYEFDLETISRINLSIVPILGTTASMLNVEIIDRTIQNNNIIYNSTVQVNGLINLKGIANVGSFYLVISKLQLSDSIDYIIYFDTENQMADANEPNDQSDQAILLIENIPKNYNLMSQNGDVDWFYVNIQQVIGLTIEFIIDYGTDHIQTLYVNLQLFDENLNLLYQNINGKATKSISILSNVGKYYISVSSSIPIISYTIQLKLTEVEDFQIITETTVIEVDFNAQNPSYFFIFQLTEELIIYFFTDYYLVNVELYNEQLVHSMADHQRMSIGLNPGIYYLIMVYLNWQGYSLWNDIQHLEVYLPENIILDPPEISMSSSSQSTSTTSPSIPYAETRNPEDIEYIGVNWITEISVFAIILLTLRNHHVSRRKID